MCRESPGVAFTAPNLPIAVAALPESTERPPNEPDDPPCRVRRHPTHARYGLNFFPADVRDGLATVAVVLLAQRQNPLAVLKGVSWAVLPLVAGLFVAVEALEQTPLLPWLIQALRGAAAAEPATAAWGSGVLGGGGDQPGEQPARRGCWPARWCIRRRFRRSGRGRC
ncbi:MAG: arsenic transporter [Roseomonas sp.]|nr:arsenic transporter [Roseomonas sp.]